MMKTKPKSTGMASSGVRPEGASAWDLRPGGLLVQKRNSNADHTSIPVPTIKVKVKYGASYHDFNISSLATFGELKKMVAGATGLHQEDQKLIFKEKERESKSFLDAVGVKDGSKIVLIEDVVSREKRVIESRKNANMNKASKEIEEISLEVDKLAMQVANLESQICGGKRVVEKLLLNLIEQLMTLLIKLDGVVADGDVKMRRRQQVKRAQKYIETLDMLKTRNSTIGSGSKIAPLHPQKIETGKLQIYPNQKQQERQRKHGNSTVQPAVATTNWETFDSGMSPKMSFTSNASSKYSVNSNNNAYSKPTWEYFV